MKQHSLLGAAPGAAATGAFELELLRNPPVVDTGRVVVVVEGVFDDEDEQQLCRVLVVPICFSLWRLSEERKGYWRGMLAPNRIRRVEGLRTGYWTDSALLLRRMLPTFEWNWCLRETMNSFSRDQQNAASGGRHHSEGEGHLFTRILEFGLQHKWTNFFAE